MTCDHQPGAAWQPSIDEAGWECYECHEELGYRPDLDRDEIWTKVHDILMVLHGQKLIYVSNGSMGEAIADNVAASCELEDRYDQLTILKTILEEPNVAAARHAEFWAQRARERCGVCGQSSWAPPPEYCTHHGQPDRLTASLFG